MSRHVFANVGRGDLADQRSAFGLVRRALGRKAVYRWAEVGEADGQVNELGALQRAFRRLLWRVLATATHVPVCVRRSALWKVESVDVIPAMEGIARISPRRHIVVVRRRRRLHRGRRRAEVNTHTVAGAFNGRQDREEQRRRSGWDRHWGLLILVVDKLHREGYDTTVGGDFNRQGGFPELHPAARLVAVRVTDRIYAVPGPGRQVEVLREGAVPIGIDFHAAIFADLRYRKAAR